MVLYKNAKLLVRNELENVDILVSNGKFIKISKNLKIDEKHKTVDLMNHLVCPGLFDIHTHGAMGYDFNMASFDEMKIIMDYYLKNGVTSVLPTIMTDDHKVIREQLKKMAKLKELYPSMKGINLEGPHLSLKYKGAMPEDSITNPSIDSFQSFIDSSNDLIVITTLAPELDGAEDFIKFAKAKKIMVSLGHSNASFDITLDALKLGANSFTHLFNAMRPLNHHDPGILGAALYSNAYTEMILDGLHLQKDTVKMLKSIRPYDRLIIVTDSIMAAGLPDGNYYLGTNKIKVIDGDARLANADTRAGSTLNPFKAILNFSDFTSTPIEKTVELMSINPARLLNLDHQIGSIEEGKDADFIVVDGRKLNSVYLQGKKVL